MDTSIEGEVEVLPSIDIEEIATKFSEHLRADTADQLIKELQYAALHSTKFAAILQETFNEANQGELNLWDAYSFRARLSEAIRYKMAMNEFAKVCVLIVACFLALYSLTPTLNPDLTEQTRLMTSLMIPMNTAWLVGMFRSGKLTKNSDLHADKIWDALVRLDRHQYHMKKLKHFEG